MGELFLYVDIDPDFIKLSTPMEKSLSPERTYRNYEFVRDMALIYRRARLPMRRLEVAPCSRKDPREALVQQSEKMRSVSGAQGSEQNAYWMDMR